MDILLNDLTNLPHRDGQMVLFVRASNYELEAVREGEGYWLYLFVVKNGRVSYLSMVRPAATVEDVQREGRSMLIQDP